MAIEFPSKPDVLPKSDDLDERLASLEAAFFADRVLHESPALTAPEPPSTPREILAWTTRRFGTALIAVTAALSIAAGYVVTERSRPPAAAVATPQRQPAAPFAQPQRRAAERPPARAAHHPVTPLPVAAPPHASAPVAHHAAARVASHAVVPRAVVYHAAEQTVVRQPAPHAPVRHTAPVVVTHASPAAPRTAAEQLAAWEATHPAARGRARATTSAEPAPQTRPRSEPAPATDTAVATGTRTEPGTGPAPGGAPDTNPGGVKTPPTNPGGIWTERLPGGGTLGGAIGPIIGAPRDPCTPRGGRTGIVMQAISVLTSSRGH